MWIFLSIWVGLGLIAVPIAIRKKGRLRVWLITGPLFGPVSLMAAIVIPPPDSQWSHIGGYDGSSVGS